LQKSIPTQIRQLILYISNSEEEVDGFVGERRERERERESERERGREEEGRAGRGIARVTLHYHLVRGWGFRFGV